MVVVRLICSSILSLFGNEDYTCDIYTYYDDEGDTYVWIDGESIFLDNEKITFSFSNPQNFPLKDFIETRNIDSYLSHDLLVLKSSDNGIYVINVKNKEVNQFKKAVEFQVSKNGKEILLLERKKFEISGDLLLVNVKSLEDEEIKEDVQSFIAKNDFDEIYVQIEEDLLVINSKGQKIEKIFKDMYDGLYAIAGDYIFFSSDDGTVIYNVEKREEMDIYDDFKASSLEIISNDIYFVADSKLYLINTKDGEIIKIDNHIRTFDMNFGTYFSNGFNEKEARKDQVAYYRTDDNEYYFYNGKDFIKSGIDEDSYEIVRLLNQSMIFIDNNDNYNYFNADNKWEGLL